MECRRLGSRSRCVPSTSGVPRMGSSWSIGTSSTTSSSSSRSASSRLSTSEITRARHDRTRPAAHLGSGALMHTGIEILAGVAILANAVIYGTDVFGALVLCPAVGAVDDRTLTQAMGHIHRIADRRIAAISIGGLIVTAAVTALAAATGRWVSTAAAALAIVAL